MDEHGELSAAQATISAMNPGKTKFIAEVSSNHHSSLERCFKFIETAARIDCDVVKFQLFRIKDLFAAEILTKSEQHRRRKDWELPPAFIPELKKCCDKNAIQFSCTPFYLRAVEELAPYVDFFKISSYELLWSDLLIECARSGLPIVLSTGLATIEEIDRAIETLNAHGVTDLTLLHCVSAYPTPIDECNLSVLGELRKRYRAKIGWSDHSVSPAVLNRAIHKWHAEVIEFHLDLDTTGAEYEAGHCWLPQQIEEIILGARQIGAIDGRPQKRPATSESPDRDWRADPEDGLRPLLHIRDAFNG
jgi:sialic acid synthase SpsE